MLCSREMVSAWNGAKNNQGPCAERFCQWEINWNMAILAFDIIFL